MSGQWCACYSLKLSVIKHQSRAPEHTKVSRRSERSHGHSKAFKAEVSVKLLTYARHVSHIQTLPTASRKNTVCVSQTSSTSQACAQWPVRDSAAGGRFKVTSNDLPEESEVEAGPHPAWLL